MANIEEKVESLLKPTIENLGYELYDVIYEKELFNSVIIAQSVLETGWAQSKIMMKSNALFGIKSSGWKRKSLFKLYE